jgi:hypothetical protein
MSCPPHPSWFDHPNNIWSNFHKRMYSHLLVQCDPCPIWPPVLPLNLTNILLILLTLF